MMLTKMAILPRLDESEDTPRRGAIWLCDPDEKITRLAIESSTLKSLRLELMTFLERMAGDNLEVAVYGCHDPQSVKACDVLNGLIHHRRIRVDAELKNLLRRKPFAQPFHGDITINYSPSWVRKPEPFDVMRGQNLADYTCPSYD